MTVVVLLIGIILGIFIYKWYQKFSKKMAKKEIEDQLRNLTVIASLSKDQEEVKRCLELAAKYWEMLKKLEKEGY